MLPSFSAGAKVQVEYTSLPPGTNIRAAHSRIPSCLSAHNCTFSGLHSSGTSFFRNIPSPEQGASTRIRSKYSSKISARCSGVSFNTQALRMPMRSTFSDSIFALDGWISFVTSSPSPSIADAIWVLFLREQHIDRGSALRAVVTVVSQVPWHWVPGYNKVPLHARDAFPAGPLWYSNIRSPPREPAAAEKSALLFLL